MNIPVISGIIQLGKTWLEGKNKKMQVKTEAEANVMMTASKNAADWDAIMAKNSGNSWKDEWILVLVSIPLVLAFFPGMVPFVNEGFAALDSMPDWYQYMVSVVVSGAYGVRKVIGVMDHREAKKKLDKIAGSAD